MSTFDGDTNHYYLYHLSSSKTVNEKDTEKMFSFVETGVD